MPDANFASGTIWASDNLPVMRGMNSACVDLIYLDPPFNSNRSYAAPVGSKAAGASFKDAWTLSDVDVCEHGELADRNPAAYAVIAAARLAHGKSMQSYLIFMAVRLMEMQRILKPTGSIYLHCDPTASHYLKLLMDAIFGAKNFRSQITWKRTTSRSNAIHSYPNVTDVILFYAMPDAAFKPVHEPHSTEYIESRYRYNDHDGRGPYCRGNMVSPEVRPLQIYEWQGWPSPKKGWRYQVGRMQELDAQGRIHYPMKPDGTPDHSKRPRLKCYLRERRGVVMGNVWLDIPPINSQAKERTGYPTQKPLALLDRIIKASSNEGDLVLDPFCGCATALVAAYRLGRDWAGIDLSPLAIKLVTERIKEDSPIFRGPTVPAKPPSRTDVGKLPNYRTSAHHLYGVQEGVCAGCQTHFPFRVMEVDHILPRSRGGTDHPDNLQLLCCGCNRSKGSKTMAQWKAVALR